MSTSNPPLRDPSQTENPTAQDCPSEKMPAFDPTPRIILRLLMLSGGNLGVKNGRGVGSDVGIGMETSKIGSNVAAQTPQSGDKPGLTYRPEARLACNLLCFRWLWGFGVKTK